MPKVAITEQYLEDIADAIREKTGLSSTYYPSEMAPAILTISGGGGITPTGTININTNGTHNVTTYASANVQVPNSYTSSDEGKVVSSGALVAQTSATYTTNNTYDTTLINSVTVNVSGGGGATLQTKSVSYTPSETAQSQTVTPDSGYDGLDKVNVSVGAISSTYVGSDITRRSSTDLSASGATVTAPAGYYASSASKAVASGTAGTPTATKGTVSNHSISVTPSVTNTTGYITGSTKTGTAVTISASELVSGSQTITTNNTYDVTNLASVIVNVEGGGGGGSVSVGTADKALSTAGSSIQFTGLSGEPIAFSLQSTETLATGASPFKVAAVVYDGSSHHGQTITNTNNAQVTYDGTSFSHTYSNGTLTVTSTGAYFQPVTYHLIYAYGGTSSNIETVDVQVGSGATSITFTGVDEDPEYWSCIFKSNFNTSSGYQRVIFNQFKDGSGVTGLEMDSSAKYSNQHWSYTYSGGSLTISSQGTNAGGYYHQPGYYQLTYTKGSGGGGGGNYQTKTVNPSTSQQIVTADTGYDALSQVTVTAMPSGTAGTPSASKGTVSNHSISVTPSVTNTTGYITGGTKTGTAVTVSASELVSGSETKTINGTYDVTNLAELVVNVSGGSPTIQSLSITPTTSEQTFNGSSVDGYKPVTVAAMPTMTLPTSASSTSSGTSKATISRSTSNQYINIPTGYNASAAYYTISATPNGSATGPSSITQSSATITTGTNTITLTKTNVSTTPTVSAGYVASATASTATVALTASVTTKAAATYHPSTTAQSISSGTYLTGAQTIAAVTTTNLSASNILSGVTIKVGDSSDDDCVASVTGNVAFQTYYTGSSAPSSSLGVNGDIYLQS